MERLMSSNQEQPVAVEAEVDEATAILVRARGFIERGWCREAIATDRFGDITQATSEDAVAWCAEGALVAAGVPFDRSFTHPATQRLWDETGMGIGEFNDAQETVEPVLAAFDRAIVAGAG